MSTLRTLAFILTSDEQLLPDIYQATSVRKLTEFRGVSRSRRARSRKKVDR